MRVWKGKPMKRTVKCASALLICLCIILLGVGVPLSAEKTIDLKVEGCWS